MRERWARVRALAWKDAVEVGQQPGLIVPALAMVAGLAAPGLALLIAVPRLTGERLADSEFAEAAAGAARLVPELADLAPEGQAQAFLLQQFLMFGLLVPVLGSLSLAAQGIVGEKQARSLEPLLATPLTVAELLAGKVITPFVLSMVLLAATHGLYGISMLTWGEPGVWQVLFWPRTLLLYLVVAPLLTMTALLVAAIISSRVNDARTAQQLGGFLALPITALFVAQLSGQYLLGPLALAFAAAGLAVVDAVLLWLGIRVFQRETILVRWK